jgi:hypothetical protein
MIAMKVPPTPVTDQWFATGLQQGAMGSDPRKFRKSSAALPRSGFKTVQIFNKMVADVSFKSSAPLSTWNSASSAEYL